MSGVTLPGSGRRTTQLGFGCAYISPENASVLDAAYDAGIRHFDVARSYGRGLTEGILGRFLKRHAGEITVTSKYGITPPFSHPLHAAVRAVIRPIVRRLRRAPSVDHHLNSIPALSTRKAEFSGSEARASLAVSLRNLGVDRIDLFLMHEPDPEDLSDPGLLHELEDAVKRGDIGAFGVGGKAELLGRLQAERANFCSVLQYEWSAHLPVPMHPGALPIVYRVHGGVAREIRGALSADAALGRRWSDEIGQDLATPGLVEQLLLHAAAALRPDAIVLFSSTKPDHIHTNVRAVTDAGLRPAALHLVNLIKAWNAARHVTT